MFDINEIRQRIHAYLEIAEQATGKRWEYHGRGYSSVVVWKQGGPGYGAVCELSPANFQDENQWLECKNNARFIAASRTEGPWLAERLLEALDEIERLRKIADAASEVLVDVGVNEKTIVVNREAAEELGRTLIKMGYWQNNTLFNIKEDE